MGPDKLQSLLYAYIENRRGADVVDFPGQLAVETDNASGFRRYDDFMFSNAVTQGGSFASLWNAPVGSLNATQSQAVSEAGRNLAHLAQLHSTARPDQSLVKFKEICLVVEPKEQTISIPVIRDQALVDRETAVSWKTCDKTAVSGTHFDGSAGEIVFGIGDTQKFIEIRILDFKDKADDLRFNVKILDYGGFYLPTPLTITLKKVSMFDFQERNVLNDLPRSLPISIDDVRFIVEGCLTSRTFHMALTHLCSSNQTVDVQLALAFELTNLCCHKLQMNQLFNVLKNYFREDDIDLENLQN